MPRQAPANVLMIGLDSADPALLRRWCDSGALPTLAGLCRRGVSGPLTTPPGLADDAVWTSFYTAVSPGRHGRYFWHTPAPESYEFDLWRNRSHAVDPFWCALSRAGLRVAVIDVPKCPLTPGLNGIQVADWLTHGRDFGEPCSWPPELAATLLQRFGDDNTDRWGPDWLCRMNPLPEADLHLMRRYLLEGIGGKTEFARELLQGSAWDLFLIVFKEAHCAGHQFWPMLDGSPDGGALGEVYRALDTAVGRIVEQAGAGARVIVFSDLGMAANVTGEHFLDSVLLALEPVVATPSQRLRIEQAAPAGRAQRLAFHVEHNEISGAIRLNVAGREPAGIVERGAEFDETARRLTTELLALRDTATGQPVISRVVNCAREYPGAETDRLPDLLAVWSRGAQPEGVVSAAIGPIATAPHPYRPGNHVSGGFYVAAGPGIFHAADQPANLLDLAPTAAALLGVTLDGAEGRPLGFSSGLSR